jgi:hypothetical protein
MLATLIGVISGSMKGTQNASVPRSTLPSNFQSHVATGNLGHLTVPQTRQQRQSPSYPSGANSTAQKEQA